MGLRSGTCPNCRSHNILISKKPRFKTSDGFWGIFGWIISLKPRNFGFPEGIILRHYICEDCYLIESYAGTEQSVYLARKHWDKLQVTLIEKDENDGDA